MDRFLKAHNTAKARAEKRRAEELAEQQELQAIQDKIQPQLTFDEQVAKANALLVSLGVTPTIKAVAQPDTPDTPDQPQLSEEEQYQTTIVSEMVALIKQRKKR
jgi:hypothetical protein